jgi:hypothetical protein
MQLFQIGVITKENAIDRDRGMDIHYGFLAKHRMKIPQPHNMKANKCFETLQEN